MKAIFDFVALHHLRHDLNAEEWEDNDDDMQVRRVFIGTVFDLLPSGKYYQPFACSNVSLCPFCCGKGTIPGHSSARIRKRNKKRYERMLKLGVKLGREYAISHAKVRNAAHNKWQKTCSICGGLGSKEAYQDECWYEQAKKELESIDCFLESGEGDPCDLFVAECRENSDNQ